MMDAGKTFQICDKKKETFNFQRSIVPESSVIKAISYKVVTCGLPNGCLKLNYNYLASKQNHMPTYVQHF